MSTKFAKDVIKELNKFRANPKSIQHQCELIHKGFSRLRANDPFLREIESFVKELETIKPLPLLNYNKVLSEAAEKELPNFRGRDDYKKYRKTVRGIVPEYFLEASPALVADDGADEPVNVLTKTLLNKLDRLKDGRSIICDPSFTEVGIAHEVYDGENMVILIFATKNIELAPEPEPLPEPDPIRSSRREFIFNIQYHETKDIKKPKYEGKVYHKIRGTIYGGDDTLGRTYYQDWYSSQMDRPKLDFQTRSVGNTSFGSYSKYTSKTASSIKPSGRVTTPSLGQIGKLNFGNYERVQKSTTSNYTGYQRPTTTTTTISSYQLPSTISTSGYQKSTISKYSGYQRPTTTTTSIGYQRPTTTTTTTSYQRPITTTTTSISSYQVPSSISTSGYKKISTTSTAYKKPTTVSTGYQRPARRYQREPMNYTATNEKTEKTVVRRRNEGTTTHYESRIETKTSNLGSSQPDENLLTEKVNLDDKADKVNEESKVTKKNIVTKDDNGDIVIKSEETIITTNVEKKEVVDDVVGDKNLGKEENDIIKVDEKEVNDDVKIDEKEGNDGFNDKVE